MQTQRSKPERKPTGILCKHKRTLKNRRKYLQSKQVEWMRKNGIESAFFREEIEALDWAIEAIELKQAQNHAAVRAAKGTNND